MGRTTNANQPDQPATASDDFRRLYVDNVDVVYRYVANRRRGASDIGDIVAEVFAVAWRRRKDITSQAVERPWLVGIARRVVADHRRSDRRRAGLIAKLNSNRSIGVDPPTVAMASEAPDLGEVLEAAMSRLSEKDRELLRLVAWDEMPRVEVAELLGCSVNALNIRLHRALRRLASELGRSSRTTRGKDLHGT